MSDGTRRPMAVSKLWVQALALTFLVGFAILGLPRHPGLPGARPGPREGRGRVRERADHPRRDLAGAGGVPHLRADAVRLGLRPRGVPRAGLHRRLPAPPGRADAGVPGRRPGGRGAGPRRTAGEPVRPDDRHAGVDRRAGPGVPRTRDAVPGGVPQPQEERGRARARTPSPTPRTAGGSPRSSRGRRGPPPPAGPAATTRTRTTGRPSRWSGTS